MNLGKTVFAQLMDYVPLREFRHCVRRYKGDHRTRSFSCLDQYLCMAFAQLTYRESLRDIEACLRAVGKKLYHMGIRGKVARSTLADANETRDWRIYADFAQALISIARALYAKDAFGVDLSSVVYALDATTIDLALSVFPWAPFQQRKAAVKLHTLLDLRGPIPSFIWITDGRSNDLEALDLLPPEPGAFYVMDRGYVDFARLYRLAQSQAFFVVRAKDNLQFQRLYSRPVDRSTGLRCDQTIRLIINRSRRFYPDKLRRVYYRDLETDKSIVLLTNNFVLSPLVLAQLYKCRWRIELFFKWIKQHLRIKAFYGTSANAVKTQIWIAISAYLLVAILRKRLRLDLSLYTMLQILSLTCLERSEIYQVLTEANHSSSANGPDKQLRLFDF